MASDFVNGLSPDDVKSGHWFTKLIAQALSANTNKVDWPYFQEKYRGVPADGIKVSSIVFVEATAAGKYRRTALERADQRVSWERPDQAFFAAGACHILAWVCRESHAERSIEITGLRFAAEQQVFHVYATWNDWAFDHSGWSVESQLFMVNQDFEGRPLERVTIAADLAAFCAEHNSRLPTQYWRDPLTRAHEYLVRHPPPWESSHKQT